MTIPQTVTVRAGSPAGTWTIELPLTESEQFDTTTKDQEGNKPMRATRITVSRRWRGLPAVLMLQGHELQHGSLTSSRLGRLTDLEEFSSLCPVTYVQVVDASEALIEQIRREADRAVEEIRGAFVSQLQ